MSTPSTGSIKVVLAALGANLGIAAAKWVGFFLTRSASMAAEAIHSTADCANQGLLLLGGKLSKKRPSATHPFGYGRESFFWSFMVAVLLFSMGGVFSVYEGIHKLQHPSPIEYPGLAVAILGVSIVLESLSYWTCLKEVRNGNQWGSLRKWVRHTTSSDLLVIFLEDTAALAGLVTALVCLLAAWALDSPIFDALGSLLVGLILIFLAVILAQETKSLLIGESPTADYQSSLETIANRVLPGAKVLALVAQQVGPSQTLIAYKIQPGPNMTELGAGDLIDGLNEIESQMRQAHPEILWQFAEPDHRA